jgi:hypothetical protein
MNQREKDDYHSLKRNSFYGRFPVEDFTNSDPLDTRDVN